MQRNSALATVISVSPLYFVVLSLMVGAAGTLYFSGKAKREKRAVLLVTMIVGAIGGVALWSVLGPMLFPGGHGFN